MAVAHAALALLLAAAYALAPPVTEALRAAFTRPLPAGGPYVEVKQGTAFPLTLRLAEARRFLASRGVDVNGGEIVIVEEGGSVRLAQMSAAKRLSLGMCLDLATATWDELRAVPGIGDKTAQRIVELRSSQKPSSATPFDLAAVKGVGPAKASRLARYFCGVAESPAPQVQRGR